MHRKIYFNTRVSQYFNIPFDNNLQTTTLNAGDIFRCPLVTWDIDMTKILIDIGEKELELTGVGCGWWEFKYSSGGKKEKLITGVEKLIKKYGGMMLW